MASFLEHEVRKDGLHYIKCTGDQCPLCVAAEEILGEDHKPLPIEAYEWYQNRKGKRRSIHWFPNDTLSACRQMRLNDPDHWPHTPDDVTKRCQHCLRLFKKKYGLR